MGIGKRVSEAFAKMIENDPEQALIQICAPIEETSQLEGRPGGKKSYKAFLSDNIGIICGFGLGRMLAGLKISYAHPEIEASPDGTCSLEQIAYHIFRCGVYHRSGLPGSIQFTDNRIGPGEGGILEIPKHIVTGLIMSVVASPVNSREICTPGRFVQINGQEFHVNEWWGKADELRKQLGIAIGGRPTSIDGTA